MTLGWWRRGLVGLVLVLAVPWVAAAEQGRFEDEGYWGRSETVLTLGVLSAAGIFSLFDEEVRREVQRRDRGTLDSLANGLDVFGHPATGLGLSAALWGAGIWRENPDLAETGQMAFEAVLVGQAATAALKYGVGRKRPDSREDAWSFKPFSFAGDHDSLPSGHTANAFALAGVLSRRGTQPWVPWAAYGMASLVGAARIQSDDHWLSDVVVGALVGELAARMVVRFHERNPDFFFGVGPVGYEGVGFRLAWSW
ncbi:phosphatase PAP2 family protein [Geoalkalibacter halelectricus]|uniref:phosphatase PAP2 family protein n=1 Tax=Geoalkalibacter halelectricus TaxID=2847045 RepID=UPI00266EFD23|nr:phosphatase PAP2 family protein [Geoalkalibacter halelectricus]MDO3379525.1 phosphatase PAP2 family protein [Geoalkalibacter halelectricus]